MSMNKKWRTGLTCTVNLQELIAACGKNGVGRLRIDEIGLDVTFGSTEMVPHLDNTPVIVDNETGIIQPEEGYDAMDSQEVVEDTLADLMISDPEGFEELVKLGANEANR